MNINLHIKRLVLDGVSLGPGQGPLLQAVVEAELTRRLKNGGLGDALQTGGAFYNLRSADIQLASDAGPEQVGRQIAGALYRGICK
ncbi:hypothetical protein Dvar_22480 [Desulfosarcina variabilis str. Montpellier]|uniref:hypothetical protein n=1 Tax=Desulfosarcina variabilis TaxID=2300 RepID=UPI003AFA921E